MNSCTLKKAQDIITRYAKSTAYFIAAMKIRYITVSYCIRIVCFKLSKHCLEFIMEKILIIKLGALGDMILAEGAIRDIRAHHPNAAITLLTSPFLISLLRNHACINHFISHLKRPRWDIFYLFFLIYNLRKKRFDYVYDLQNNHRTALYHKLMLPITWSGKTRFSTYRYPQDHSQSTSCCSQLSAQLAVANVPIQYCMHPNWSWLCEPAHDIMHQFQLSPGFILILPGCSKRHPEKRWPGFAQLSTQLQSNGFHVVFATGPEEIELINSTPGTWVLDHGKPIALPKLLGLSQQAALVIGNDSGPIHLLACNQTQGIALFQNKKYVTTTNIEHYYTVFCADPINQISVDQVYQAAHRKLTHQT